MRVVINGFTGADIQASVATAIVALNGTVHYAGSDIDVRTESVRPRVYEFTLKVRGSAVVGSAFGYRRRTRNACWHLHRDVLAALFTLHPYATVRTRETVYIGQSDFDATMAATGERNIGTMADPVRMIRACSCNLGADDYGPGVQRAITRLVRVRPRDQVAPGR